MLNYIVRIIISCINMKLKIAIIMKEYITFKYIIKTEEK